MVKIRKGGLIKRKGKQRKSGRVSKQAPKTDAKSNTIFVMNTRRTRRSFNSLTTKSCSWNTECEKKKKSENSKV